MNWYLSKIVFRIICGDGHHQAQFDEQLRLIRAENEKIAFEKASRIGLREEDSFFNQQEKLVQWKFINVAELYKISDLLDGAELYSKIEETSCAESYIDLVHKKANHILENRTHQFLELL